MYLKCQQELQSRKNKLYYSLHTLFSFIFKILVSCVVQNAQSPVFVFFKSLHLHWHICNKSNKSN